MRTEQQIRHELAEILEAMAENSHDEEVLSDLCHERDMLEWVLAD